MAYWLLTGIACVVWLVLRIHDSGVEHTPDPEQGDDYEPMEFGGAE